MKLKELLFKRKNELQLSCANCVFYSRYNKRTEHLNDQKEVTIDEIIFHTCTKGDMVLTDVLPCKLHLYKEYGDFYNQVDSTHAYFKFEALQKGEQDDGGNAEDHSHH